MSTIENQDDELRLHLYTIDDPRLWEFRSRLSDDEFTIPELSDEEWNAFHSVIAEA